MKNLQIFELNIFVLILVCPIPEAIGQMMSTTFVPEHKEAEDLQAFILNMDFKNTDLKDIIRLLAKQYGLNIFIADDVNKRLTLHLVNVSLAEALDFMLQETQLALQKTGSIYKIFNPTMSDTSVFSNPASKIDFQDGLLSVDFQDNDIREAFYQISKITNHTILI